MARPPDGNLDDGTMPRERPAQRRAGDLSVRVVRLAARGFSGPARVAGVIVQRLLPVLLDAGGTQAGETMLVDGVLPGEEFFDGEGVATAGFLERKQAAADGSNDLGLAPDDPALRARCRQIGDRQRAAVRPDNVFCPWSKGLRQWINSRTRLWQCG